MIYIKIDNDTFYDDAIVLVRSFYPRMEVKAYKQDTVATEADKVIDITVPDMTGLNKSEMHDKFKSYLYDRLSQMTGKTLPWGYLTGVRPSKIAYVMLEDGEDEQTIKKHFVNKHKASEKKASPCHQFVGNEDFLMGNVDEGITRNDIRDEFKSCNVYSKEKCKNCFAKFYCSGGCAANSYNFHGNINDAYDVGCEMQKKRIECAIMIRAAMAED